MLSVVFFRHDKKYFQCLANQQATEEILKKNPR